MKRVPSGGYTIIEVMIVLVISGSLLTTVSLLINGRIERTRFTQSVTVFEQKLKDTLNDVSTGYYPSDNNVTCSSTGSTVTIATGAAPQGTNACIYLGKAIELTGGTYNVYTMAAAKSATSLSDAGTKLLGSPGLPGVVDRNTIEANITIKKVASLQDGHTMTGLALVSEFSQVNAVSNAVTGNAARVTLYEVPNGSFLGTAGTAAMLPVSSQGVVICLQQDGKRAAVTIGADGQRLTTQSQINGDWPGVCTT